MSDGARTIKVAALARVEGEGGLHLRLCGNHVEELRLDIYEPPRLFEALLRGRALEDAPDITARICGICPVAYQMSAVHALEKALGVAVTPEIRQLRRLLYCGEWIESHSLHIHLLHAPDFLGYASGIDMARDHADAVQRGLMLKKHGNSLLERLGGRAVHPINVRVGGFHHLPSREEMASLIPSFEWGVEAAADVVRWVAAFDFPTFDAACDYTALQHDEYPMNEGCVATSDGARIDVREFEQCYAEHQVPHSTALHALRRSTGKPYLLGPLSRLNLNRDRLSPTARKLADDIGFETPCVNRFKAIVARALEVVHAYETALGILRDYRPVKPASVAYERRAGEGCAATEAPRGLLYHRYRIDEDGTIAAANIVPPTSQNQAQIESDLRHVVENLLPADDAQLGVACERLVRSYDPCISCSTHFLRVVVHRE